MIELTTLGGTRLVTILGRLESSSAGERDAAALAAVGFLRKHKLTWDDDIAPPNYAAPLSCEPGDWHDDIERCIRSFTHLTDWEREFVVSLRGYRQPSPKQAAILCDIAAKARRAA